MEVPLALALANKTGLFEQVGLNGGTGHLGRVVEVEFWDKEGVSGLVKEKYEKKDQGAIPVNFPKRLELLLRRVLALPKASRMGLASRTLFSSSSIVPTAPEPLTAARNLMTCLQLSVFPAPDSPLK